MALEDKAYVLMSFGAALGGFEFALQLRDDIYERYRDIHKMTVKSSNSHPSLCYLDAASLNKDPQTRMLRRRDIDTSFMRNKEWEAHYEAAMRQCRVMIFFFTREWMESTWCNKELQMLANMKRNDLTVITAIWPNARIYMTDTFKSGAYAKIKNNQEIDLMGNEVISASVSGRNERETGVNNYGYSTTDRSRRFMTRRIVECLPPP